jgi:5-epimerase
VRFRELAVPGVVEFTPSVFPDARGRFVAPFQESAFLDATGHRLHLAQSNHSISRRGVIRGVHFSDVPPGQAKYVYCSRGALLDVAIDVRVGSPTFGRWESVLLDTETYRAVYLPEGIGHAFIALTDDTIMTYLCSTEYDPAAEHTVYPLDPALGLPWPPDLNPVLSDKDREAPTLAEATHSNILPRWVACQTRYSHLRALLGAHSAGWAGLFGCP